MRKTCIVLGILFLAAAAGSSAQQTATGNRNDRNNRTAARSPSVIEVSRCRIKFVQEATVAAGQSGILKFVTPIEGATVKADALIAGLVDDVPRQQLILAQHEAKNHVDVEYAKLAFDVAKVELQKAKAANVDTPGTVPEVEVLRLKLAADRAELQIKLAEHKDKANELTAKLREAELKSYEVKAPIDGVVTNVLKHKGEAVRQGDPILEIVNPKLVRAEAQLTLSDALAIKVGDKVELVLNAPGLQLSDRGRTFQGKVTFVDVGVNFATRVVRVWATLENRDHLLRSGQEARLRIFPSRTGK